MSDPRKPLIVGVTGDSGSGKSFYSEHIRRGLDTKKIAYTYINADDFLISRADREPMKTTYYQDGPFVGKSHWEILENMFRLDELARVIDACKSNTACTYHAYDRSTGMVSEKITQVEPESLVIFDTSMLHDQMDLLIEVDVSQEHIIQRKIARDSDIRTPEQIIDMHTRVQGYYWSRCRPAHADIVIDNNDFKSPSIVLG